MCALAQEKIHSNVTMLDRHLALKTRIYRKCDLELCFFHVYATCSNTCDVLCRASDGTENIKNNYFILFLILPYMLLWQHANMVHRYIRSGWALTSRTENTTELFHQIQPNKKPNEEGQQHRAVEITQAIIAWISLRRSTQQPQNGK